MRGDDVDDEMKGTQYLTTDDELDAADRRRKRDVPVVVEYSCYYFSQENDLREVGECHGMPAALFIGVYTALCIGLYVCQQRLRLVVVSIGLYIYTQPACGLPVSGVSLLYHRST